MSDPRISPSIFTRGAVDLSALRAQSAARAAAPARPADNGSGQGSVSAVGPRTVPGSGTAATLGDGAGPGAAGGGRAVVIDVTEATFQAEVLERSMTTPVVIEFWAEWCQPCRQLGPLLEKLAVESAGAWVLARVDVEANPRLAQMFRIQGIPLTYAVVNGQPVDGFPGALPESQLRQWIDAVLKAAGVAVASPEDPRLTSADDALMSGDLDAAEQAYKKILAENPADAAAEAGLAQVMLTRRVSGTDPAAALAAAAKSPDDVKAQLLAADVEVLSGQADAAYGRLIDLIRRVAGDDRETVRRHLLSLFTIAGPNDPAVSAARRALASALF